MTRIIDGAMGIYVPQEFAKRYDLKVWHIEQEAIDILLEGPDHEHYWEVWDEALTYARFSANGHTWGLYQDGDLFTVRDDYDWDN
jgi:hypothetical protein